MKFSQRQGITPLPANLKPDAMPDELRNVLWNHFNVWFGNQPDKSKLLEALWHVYWNKPIDEIPIGQSYSGTHYYKRALEIIRQHFFEAKWYEVYDFLEFFIGSGYAGQELGKSVNKDLSIKLAAYRVINQQFVPITTEHEIAALEEALANKDKFSHAASHIATAISHLSNKQNPDYRNSIKESISAVESVAKIICDDDKATLAQALSKLKKSSKLHGALSEGYTKLYAYTSDANGIRHALMNEPNLTIDDAKYFLIICTAFVNYLKTLA
ncbi:MAG: hypothetical protein M0Z83_07155 [Betaproteobacteria bacterium]|nr:hypothetical protein [Betaproteobacteria bacterium]